MTDSTTDDTEHEPTRDELENRVEQLEQTVQQMLPSRRDALKLGGTALAAGALGSAATGSASAGTNSVGTLGSASNPLDAELEDVNPGSVRAVNYNNNEITNVSSLSTEEVAKRPFSKNIREIIVSVPIGNSGVTNVSSGFDNVGTSATAVADVNTAGLVNVVGRDTNNTADLFSDLVLVAFNSASVVGSVSDGGAASRTYNGNSAELELTMASGAYNVHATIIANSPQNTPY
jgi:hypothetical protein